jgi:DNA polymerase III subunit beta
MKLTILQAEFARALRAVSRAVGNGKTHPILSGVLIEPHRLTAYDLELAIQSPITAVAETTGSCVAPFRLLSDIIGRLDPADAITLALEGSRLAISSAAGSYSLSVASADDFPALPTVDAAAAAPVDITDALAAVLPAVSTDSAKQLLTGVHMVADGAMLHMEATDGHRLAVRAIPCDAAPFDATVPAKALAAVRQPASFAFAAGQVAIALADGTHLVARTLDGAYPNAQALIPTSFKQTATCNRNALLQAAERIAVVADNGIIKLAAAAGALQISAESEASSGTESVALAGKLPSLAINARYLADGLKGFADQDITIATNQPTAPVVIQSGNAVYLVMPVQVRE